MYPRLNTLHMGKLLLVLLVLVIISSTGSTAESIPISEATFATSDLYTVQVDSDKMEHSSISNHSKIDLLKNSNYSSEYHKNNNSDIEVTNSSTIPNFQSFEEWKRNKFIQEKEKEKENLEASSNVSDSSHSLYKQQQYGADNGRRKTTEEDTNTKNGNINRDIKNIQKGDIHQRIKKRSEEGNDNNNNNNPNHNDNANNVNPPVGEDVVFEISMFSGIDDEQGKLYQDRFNYASFDCAATIVKTNKEAKGANSILIENKDSYLLNECSSLNKFIIIELCEDILVDEVLIGNYEFYSSMFKNIRISVSDRFPTTQWVILGEFEAENIRQLQTFRIENPLIWAKFLKIEFLTHFGNEFYCPISSVKVHGTTMIEQFKDENPDIMDDSEHYDTIEENEVTTEDLNSVIDLKFKIEKDFMATDIESKKTGIPEFDVELSNEQLQSCIDFDSFETKVDCTSKYLKLDQFLINYEEKRRDDYDQCLVEEETASVLEMQQTHTPIQTQTQTSIAKIQPQDSIYKNIIKRLNLLESNASLSLLYIEEQSRLLSDAFTNMEEQQAIKFQAILTQLNSTIQSQMDIFDKLNTDVYVSFSRLFEYQQQIFDSQTIEISDQLKDINGSITFYRNITYVCILMIIFLFLYILLTKDLYIDEAYLQQSNIPQSPIFSPTVSPSISPASSLSDIKAALDAKSLDDNLRTTTPKSKKSYSISDSTATPIQRMHSSVNSISSAESTINNQDVTLTPTTVLSKNSNRQVISTPIPVLYCRRSSLLDNFSKNWSLSPNKGKAGKSSISKMINAANSYRVEKNSPLPTPEQSRSSSPSPTGTTYEELALSEDRERCESVADEDGNETYEYEYVYEDEEELRADQ